MTPVSGLIGLVGSGEFLPQMVETDRILLAGRPETAIHLPTAAGQEGPKSINRWASLATIHYESMGVSVETLPVIDSDSANDPGLARQIEGVGLVYLSGGSPAYCSDTLRDSAVWKAIVSAWESGTSVAGCSAGACTLSAVAPNPRGGHTAMGLGLIPDIAVIPHYDRMKFFIPMFGRMVRNAAPPGTQLIGIEEDTALVGRPGEPWRVTGSREVVLLDRDHQRFTTDSTITL